MQEKLKIFSAEGDELLERDLSGVARPLMILAGDSPQIVDSVPLGAEVLGALVRDEDGWTLASAKSDQPVTSGPKAGADFHLTAGVSCALGPWVFRIEREGSGTGTVLLWRVGSSEVAADPLLIGRNVVSAASEKSYVVNPAVPGIELCSIFPTANGVDVMAAGDEARRLSVPYATLFSVGPFQGMALKAPDAAAAVKSGRPFGWAARKTRTGLMAAMIVCGLVCLGALTLMKERRSVEAAVAQKHGAQQVERKLMESASGSSNEDVLVYKFSFYRSLPIILKADPSPITRDLISRGEQLAGNMKAGSGAWHGQSISNIVKFLKDVDAIQVSVQKGDWQSLKSTLAGCDREAFTRCDADSFRQDAEEIEMFVTETLPGFMEAVSRLGAKDIDKIKSVARARFDNLKDNIFMLGDVVRRERAIFQERRQVIAAYVTARERFLSSSGAPDPEMAGAWADLVEVLDPEERKFADMVERERKLIADVVLKRAEKANPTSLIRLCALGETVGIDPAKLAEWTARAAEARKGIAAKYRELYSDYRMRAAVAPSSPETLAILDAMIALGLEDNTFHQWAVREKQRVKGRKGGEK